MSLMSLMGNYTSSGSQSLFPNVQLSAATQKAIARRGERASSHVPDGDKAQISDAAKAAATAKADNAKDFGALGKEVRATLDAQYAAGKPKGAPDLTGMSGRGLAAMALNRNGDFSAHESTAAKKALNSQARISFIAAAGSGGNLTALAAYGQQVVKQYDAMSSEEKQARGWTAQFRASNANLVSTVSSASMFDQVD